MFPERHTVTLEARVEGATDSMGVPVVSYLAPVEVPVYGWAPPSPDQELRPELSGVRADLDVYCRTPFAGAGDRVTVNGEVFTAVGSPEEYDFGPFGFTPGCRVSLKRIEG